MSNLSATDRARELLEKKYREYNYRNVLIGSVFVVLMGITFFGAHFYLLTQSERASDISKEISEPFIEHGGASEMLMSAIDKKLVLLKSEISLKLQWLNLLGGLLIGLGFSIPYSYRKRIETKEILISLLDVIDEKNS